MEFSEIAKILGLTETEVIKIYKEAMRKLKAPGINRILWEYEKIGDSIDNKDDSITSATRG
jgi:predicted transcriptional regulator